jgi:hypothetical protein
MPMFWGPRWGAIHPALLAWTIIVRIGHCLETLARRASEGEVRSVAGGHIAVHGTAPSLARRASVVNSLCELTDTDSQSESATLTVAAAAARWGRA